MSANVLNNNLTIVYLAYGVDSSKYQAILSIYTLFHHLPSASNLKIVIYTDEHHLLFNLYLRDLPVSFEVLTKEQVKNFKGENEYIFRIKPSIIKEYFSKQKGNVFYLDTDTFFIKNPIQLFNYIAPGYTIMNVEEYNFIDGGKIELPHWFALRQILKRNSYTINGQLIDIPLATVMWNSGIIGLNYTDSVLIKQSICLIDEMYNFSQIFNIEQLAISYVLQSATQLRSTDGYINHYWLKEIKNSFNIHIPEFLRKNEYKIGKELYSLAFEFAEKMSQIHTPIRESMFNRINTRLKLIMKVARKGYL